MYGLKLGFGSNGGALLESGMDLVKALLSCHDLLMRSGDAEPCKAYYDGHRPVKP